MRNVDPSPLVYASIPRPPPSPNYTLVCPPLHVPKGCLPIQIVQFHHTATIYGGSCPNHWALFVPTSRAPGIGNYYEFILRSGAYATQSVFNTALLGRAERGSFTVGYLPARLMPILEMWLNLVRTEHIRDCWAPQQWVWEALKTIEHHSDICITKMSWGDLNLQMSYVEAAWAGKAV